MKSNLTVKALMDHFHIRTAPDLRIIPPSSVSLAMWTDLLVSNRGSDWAFGTVSLTENLNDLNLGQFLVRLQKNGSIKITSLATVKDRVDAGVVFTLEEHLLDLITSELAITGEGWIQSAEVVAAGVHPHLDHERSYRINWADNCDSIELCLRRLSNRAVALLNQNVPSGWVISSTLQDLDRFAGEWEM